jgi:hypothetical protein
MRVGLLFSFLVISFFAIGQTAPKADSAHYFSVINLNNLPETDGEYIQYSVETSPDGLSYLAFASGPENKKIWTSRDGLNWSNPYLSFSNSTFSRLIKDAPDEFSISDLKFEPAASLVSRASWNTDPLLSFYSWSDMHFCNSRVAYMLLEGKLYKSIDAGNRWKQIAGIDNYINSLFFDRNDIYAVLNTNDFIKIDARDSIRKAGRFKTAKRTEQIYSIQFQNDTIAYYLISGGAGKPSKSLYKSVNDVISRKPLLRLLPPSAELVVNNKSVLLWDGAKQILQSVDGGENWVHYKEADSAISHLPEANLGGLYLDNDSNISVIDFSEGNNDGMVSIGKLLFDKYRDTGIGIKPEDRIKALAEKAKLDSLHLCNCKNYASSIENRRQIENGKYYQTELKYLIDKVPLLTLNDGAFLYDPKSFYKESPGRTSFISKAKGTYIAGENTITFSNADTASFFKGTFYYLFNGDNFWIYKCDKEKGLTDRIQFYSFRQDDSYHPPSVAEKPEPIITLHASDFIYSFPPDSEKFTITLQGNTGEAINNASIKFDDIYATPMVQDGVYYFDRRTISEFTQSAGKTVYLVISHPDYQPLVAGFSKDTKKYVLQRKKK